MAMSIIFTICYIFLGIGFLLSLYRLILGPTVYDRIIALDLVGALIMCSLGVYAVQTGQFVYLDVILAIALIAFLGTVAFARYLDIEEQRAARDRLETEEEPEDSPLNPDSAQS